MILHGIEYQRPTSLNMRILADHVTYSFLAFMKSIFHFYLGCYCGGYSQNGRSNLSSFKLTSKKSSKPALMTRSPLDSPYKGPATQKTFLWNDVITSTYTYLPPVPVDMDHISAIATQITIFMGPTWGPPGSCRPQMGPVLAPWTMLSGYTPGAITVWRLIVRFFKNSMPRDWCLYLLDQWLWNLTGVSAALLSFPMNIKLHVFAILRYLMIGHFFGYTEKAPGRNMQLSVKTATHN